MEKHQERLILFPFPGDSLGGSTISATFLLQELQRSGTFRVRVILQTAQPLAGWFHKHGIPVEVLDDAPVYDPKKSLVARSIDLLRSRQSIRKVLKRHRPALVHTNDIRTHITWGFGILGARTGHIWHQRTKWPKSRFASWLAPRAAQRIAISLFVQESLREQTGLDSIVIPNPLAKGQTLPSAVNPRHGLFTQPRQYAEPPIVIGYVGAYTRQKRPKDFIDIVKETEPSAGAQVYWIMIGKDGDYTAEELRQYAARLNVLDVLKIYPFQDHISDWYAAMDLLIVTSEEEGFGRNIVEAMAASTLVIASRSGAHEELIEHGKTGYLVALGDISAYSDLVLTSLDQAAAGNVIKAAAVEYVSTEFCPTKSAERVCSVYTDALA